MFQKMQGYELLLLWNYGFVIWYCRYIHTKSMSKDMTGREKVLFIASFMWAMHWGVRLNFAAFTTLELKFF